MYTIQEIIVENVHANVIDLYTISLNLFAKPK